MKKRIMAALLCLSLLTGTAAVYAEGDAETTAKNGSVKVDNLGTEGNAQFDDEINYTSNSIDINAQAMLESPSLDYTHVYQVEILWGDMAFAYGDIEPLEKNWNPQTHEYSYDDAQREANKKWYLINEGMGLTGLRYDAEDAYNEVLDGTDQNYVLMFNHSDLSVQANVSITNTYAENNIVASIAPATDFGGATGTENTEAGGYDFTLGYDDQKGTGEAGKLYQKNDTMAALKVTMPEGDDVDAPTGDILQQNTPKTVAKITIKLSKGSDAEDDSEVDAGA